MKIINVLARILLGAIFAFFGSNAFLHFFNPGGPPPGAAGSFFGAIFSSGYIYFVAGVQVLAGILILIGIYRTLALVLSGALLANIVAFHLTMDPPIKDFSLALVCVVLWLILAASWKSSLAPLFARK
jgi:putative oxidoreductase